MGHSTPEWIFVGTVIALLIWVGAESWRVEHTLEFAPPNSETVKVIGTQWFWSFEHADGSKEINELHVKQGIPYRFELVSNDVIHDFAVPDFAILMDVVPGRVNTVWNEFDQTGKYLIECREYCGQGHHDMRATLYVEPNTAPSTAKAPQGVSLAGGFTRVTSPEVQGNVSQGTGFLTLVNPGPLGQNNTAGSANTSSSTAGTNASASVKGPTVALKIAQGASTQGNPNYMPATLTVKKGDTVIVTNDDTVPHTVTNGKGTSDPQSGKLFDTSMIMPKATAKIDTSKLAPGDYPFYCSVHPSFMQGTLKVQ